jgi:hypothetical protein
MQLTYRAAQYQVDAPKIEIAPGQAIGSYRGVTIHFQSSSLAKCLQLTVPLKYRGVSYLSLL